MVKGGPPIAAPSMANPCLGALVIRANGTSTPGTIQDSPFVVGVPVTFPMLAQTEYGMVSIVALRTKITRMARETAPAVEKRR